MKFLRILLIFGWLIATCFFATDSFAGDRAYNTEQQCKTLRHLIVNSYKNSYINTTVSANYIEAAKVNAIRADALQDLYFKLECEPYHLTNELIENFREN